MGFKGPLAPEGLQVMVCPERRYERDKHWPAVLYVSVVNTMFLFKCIAKITKSDGFRVTGALQGNVEEKEREENMGCLDKQEPR